MDAIPPGTDLSRVPLMPNPNGDPPNFVNPPSLYSAGLGVGVTLMIMSGIMLVFRLAMNIKLSKKLCLDDYLCIVAQLGGMAYWVLYHELSLRGSSTHAWDVPLSVLTVSYIQIQASIQIIAAPTLWAAKSAILALYIRLFSVVRWLRITSYACIFLMALFYGSNIIIAVVYCIPRKGEAWDGTSFQRCSSSAWSAVMIGVFSLAADLFIFIVPFPVILKLQLGPAKKIGLVFLFLTGLVLVVLSAACLAFRVKVFDGKDPTWNGGKIVIITFAEIFGTIMVSCVPAMSAFWTNVLMKSPFWSSIRSSMSFSSWKSAPSEKSISRPSFDTSWEPGSQPRKASYQTSVDSRPSRSEGRESNFHPDPTTFSPLQSTV
ncbi:hypothetical protein C7974DRAFT_301211 [Boeremia exigua]|uniref:uncharacterized protein n=1 Tax=Boeremia exigua TaxID=749465 RepID=UPI001E8CA115|nr:uncharacterized protein C7974DRAFT_301211 [Boeremia exigua]KAH6641949.1 hypothetical protein C7974DRAFT_301211 [Boeremia exigua]